MFTREFRFADDENVAIAMLSRAVDGMDMHVPHTALASTASAAWQFHA